MCVKKTIATSGLPGVATPQVSFTQMSRELLNTQVLIKYTLHMYARLLIFLMRLVHHKWNT